MEALGKRNDKTSVEKLREALVKDTFYGVRLAASRALRGMDSEHAFEALVSSPRQKDARVRRQVVSDLGSFYKPEALTALKKSLQGEKNPAIRGSAIRALAGFGDPGAAGEVEGLEHRATMCDFGDGYVSELGAAGEAQLRQFGCDGVGLQAGKQRVVVSGLGHWAEVAGVVERLRLGVVVVELGAIHVDLTTFLAADEPNEGDRPGTTWEKREKRGWVRFD